MMPSAWVVVDALPLNANEKIDRRALPPPDWSRPDGQKSFAPPHTPVEERLASIWAGVLGVERVGVEDNFFDLGGHSLLATQVISGNGGHKFTLGPLSLTLRPGETVFITGGNGSGKTTLAKLITGLYVPEAGEIHVDGRPVTYATRAAYRQYFSVVFSDFFLFENLFGLGHVELDARARDYLVKLQLDEKVEVKDGALSTLDLSQGQRKRLALLTAYLEYRPIYLFDEWAADLDPEFREVFYFRLLPELKARGKMILVISHDDRYYYLADRLVKLDYGHLVYDKPAAFTPSVTGTPVAASVLKSGPAS
jgi:ABC-type siderophore export system fused ATPase/permease subunit